MKSVADKTRTMLTIEEATCNQHLNKTFLPEDLAARQP
jgi:hypothetical protein